MTHHMSGDRGGPERDAPLTVGIITTKGLDPPVDGRADTLWKRVQLLEEEPRCRVVLLTLCPQPASVTSRIRTVPLDFAGSLGGFVAAFLKGLPLQVCLYHNPGRVARIGRELEELDLDVVVADMARTALLALGVPARRRVLDMDDRLSRRYRGQSVHGRAGTGFGKTPPWLPGFLTRLAARFDRRILALEAKRLGRFEETVCASFDEVVLVSADEARDLAAATGRRVTAVPNYIEFTSRAGSDLRVEEIPDGTLPPAPPRRREPATILFFGNLSTAHNVDTAVHLARDIFPLVRKSLPAARLKLVGRNMAPEIAALASAAGVSVESDVPDILPHLDTATVCVCPMRFGSGVKTKILEALARGLPVVTTPIGAEGIPEAEDCLVIAEGDAAVARATADVLLGTRPTRELTEAGRALVARRYSKDAVRTSWWRVVRGGGGRDDG